MISKDTFVKAINDVKTAYDFQMRLDDFYRKNRGYRNVDYPDCIDTIIDLLHSLFGRADRNGWIEYFCFELDFGRKYKDGMIIYKNGGNIRMKTAEDLYDFLISETENNNI